MGVRYQMRFREGAQPCWHDASAALVKLTPTIKDRLKSGEWQWQHGECAAGARLHRPSNTRRVPADQSPSSPHAAWRRALASASSCAVSTPTAPPETAEVMGSTSARVTGRSWEAM